MRSGWSLLPADTRVLLNNGEHVGFVKADGTFSMCVASHSRAHGGASEQKLTR